MNLLKSAVTGLMFLTQVPQSAAQVGSIWAQRDSWTSGDLSAIAYGNARFVAVGYTNAAFITVSSSDGISWTSRNAGVSNFIPKGITYGAGQFVAVGTRWDSTPTGAKDSGGIFVSSDGITWTSRSSSTANLLYSVAYGNGLFVVVGRDVILTSSDTVTWTAQSTTYWLNNIGFGNAQFIAVGWHEAIVTSSDGVNWTGRRYINPSLAIAHDLQGIAYGNRLFVAVGGDLNNILSSEDAITWTSRDSLTTPSLRGVAYGDGQFVAVGPRPSLNANAAILSSADGVAWTTRASGTQNALHGIAYGNGQFAAVGDKGTVLTSGTAGAGTGSTSPSITAQPQSQSALTASSVSLCVEAKGGTSLSYQWRKGGIDIPGGTGACYTIPRVQSSDAGNYQVVVSNSTGAVISADAILAVTPSSAGNLGSMDFVWARRAGGVRTDVGDAVAVDHAGNVYATGSFTGSVQFGSITLTSSDPEISDAFLVKYDGTGNVLWAIGAHSSAPHNNELSSSGQGLAVDPAGNVYVTGTIFGGVFTFGQVTVTVRGDNLFLAKCDSLGNVLWVSSAGYRGGARGTFFCQSRAVAADDSGNVYVTGVLGGGATFGTTTVDVASTSAFLAKYDAGGSIVWVRTAGGPNGFTKYGSAAGFSLALDGSRNVYVTGSFGGTTVTFGSNTLSSSQSGQRDVFIAKYDENGNILWVRQGGNGNATATAVIADSGGSAYLTGFFQNTAMFGATALTSFGETDIFIARFDTSGNVLWVRQAGGKSLDGSGRLAVDTEGGLYLTGHSYGPALFGTVPLEAGNAVFVSKLDSAGNFVWVRQAGGDKIDVWTGQSAHGSAVAVDQKGNVYATGFFPDATNFGSSALRSAGGLDIFLTKLAPSGVNSPTDIATPTLAITSHSNGQTVSSSSITISGTATDAGRGDSGISSVTVNGARANGDTANGATIANWSRTITLTPGGNSLTVTALDNSANQNTATLSITVIYQPPLKPPIPGALQWKSENGGNGHWYKIVTGSFSWNEARAAAQEAGGHLATITTQNEQDFVQNILLPSVQMSLTIYAIGGERPSFGDWRWVTGEPWAFTAWAPRAPNEGLSGEAWLGIYADGSIPFLGPNSFGKWEDGLFLQLMATLWNLKILLQHRYS